MESMMESVESGTLGQAVLRPLGVTWWHVLEKSTLEPTS